MLHRNEIVRVRRGGKNTDILAVREQGGFEDLNHRTLFNIGLMFRISQVSCLFDCASDYD